MTEGMLEARDEAADDGAAFWRYLALVQAGYPAHLARPLAREGIDVERATALLAAGCPPPLAARIVL